MKHRTHTGQNNNLIIINLSKLVKYNKHKIIVRTPLIPDITHIDENLRKIKELLKVIGVNNHETLAYNPVP